MTIAASKIDASSAAAGGPALRWLGRVDYEPTWDGMRAFTDSRTAEDRDQIWFLEHPAVFTLGMNGKREHVLAPADIPVVQIDRGGQVTYHGPGQLVVYPLIDVRRLGIGVRQLVVALENAVIALAAEQAVVAAGRRDAPGVYVNERKLASIGLRIRRGCSYHGLALNVSMDLEPFGRINPCGYAGLQVTDLKSLGTDLSVEAAAHRLAPHLLRSLSLPDQPVWS
ncbi:lipoyl(octanoyl) transferase [Povalibacter uvarum]|uniref:Octanoyltransferase n=1 Tax=Povalibacter uvarum TaxID=732238 RepID=A0A841HQ82_9GAMM|nr:lipoyl(octanoyl) transferase LipB [Povalibacter uvarum]MBB6094390.1 lipoyl(octanoyl) transferase [Povalibacter uvarum]